MLRSLQNRRLVVRSGDRLNLYWDIFKDYVLTQAVPALPFTYLPSSTSIKAMLSVAQQLQHDRETNLGELTSGTSIGEGTVQNIIHDLLMFGVATGSTDRLRLDERVESPNAVQILQRIRQVLRRHALTQSLSKFDHGRVIRLDDLIEALKATNRAAQHRARTWRLYAERIAPWLAATGFLTATKDGWVYFDRGSVSVPSQRRRRIGVFLGEAPPTKVLDAVSWLAANGPQTAQAIKVAGYRNAARVLLRFGLAQATDESGYALTGHARASEPRDALWRAARDNEVVRQVVRLLESNPSTSREQIAENMRLTMKHAWTPASKKRIGTGLWQWAIWVMLGLGKRRRSAPPAGPTGKAVQS